MKTVNESTSEQLFIHRRTVEVHNKYNLTKQKALYPVITRQTCVISRTIRNWTRDGHQGYHYRRGSLYK